MKKLILILSVWGLVIPLFAQNLPALATENVFESDRWKNWSLPSLTGRFGSVEEALDFYFDSIAAQSPLKGFRATIIFPDSSIWQRVTGINAQNPPENLNLDMAVGYGSATKMLTATVVHQLVVENKLSLDDPVGLWLPPMNNISPDITVRQLLNHTSGLSNYTENLLYLLAVISDFSHIWTPEELLPYQLAPWFDPGTGWYYSNTNYLLLSMIIEKATGQAYSQELRNRLLTPLQMDHTFSYPSEPPSVPVAHIWYDLNGDGVTEDFQNAPGSSVNAIFSSLRGSAQLLGSTADLARFTRSLVKGHLLPDDGQQALMTFDSLSSYQENGVGYGLGITRRTLAGRTMLGHNGYVFHQTRAYHFPEENITLVAQTNEGSQDSTITNLNDMFAMLALTCFQYSSPTHETPSGAVLVSVHPNPATDYVWIGSDGAGRGQFRLFNASGALARKETTAPGNSLYLVVADLDPGMYTWTWEGETGRTVGKVVIMR